MLCCLSVVYVCSLMDLDWCIYYSDIYICMCLVAPALYQVFVRLCALFDNLLVYVFVCCMYSPS